MSDKDTKTPAPAKPADSPAKADTSAKPSTTKSDATAAKPAQPPVTTTVKPGPIADKAAAIKADKELQPGSPEAKAADLKKAAASGGPNAPVAPNLSDSEIESQVKDRTAKAIENRDAMDKSIIAEGERKEAARRSGEASRPPEEDRSGQPVEPPTPAQKIQSHQPGQANGPNQRDQARTDRGEWLEPGTVPESGMKESGMKEK